MLSNFFIHYKQIYKFFNDFIHFFYNFFLNHTTDDMSLFSQILSITQLLYTCKVAHV